jgi:GDP-4-dehydro-6-deoxy-D-mannose reductase
VRVLVTGIGGFVGPVLADALVAAGHGVHGLVRGPVAPRLARLGVPLTRGDLLDPGLAERVVDEAAPEAVVHLAGLTAPALAEADPRAAYRANVDATLALLAAVRARAPRSRILIASSGEVYGAVPRTQAAVAEDAPLAPVTVYGASKAAAEVAALQWGRAYGLDVVCARPFSHTGTGQADTFVCAAFARRLAAIEAGHEPPLLRVGNLDPVRDFTDVRDVARGWVALLERGRSGAVYNLCRGEGVSIAEVLALLRTRCRVAVRVERDPALVRPVDLPRSIGSPARVAAETGWHAEIPLEETLSAVLDDWRARVATGLATAG